MKTEEVLQRTKPDLGDKHKLVALLTSLARLEKAKVRNPAKLKNKLSAIDRETSALAGGPVKTLLAGWSADYKVELDAAINELQRRFGVDLEKSLRELGLKLSGQYPKLHAGLFTFEVDFEKGGCKIWYGPQQELLAQVSLNAEAVASRTRKLQENLGSQLEVDQLMRVLAHSYRFASLDAGTAPIAIPVLLPYVALLVQSESFRRNPIKEKYKSYGRADFSYDLFRMRSATGGVRLSTATRQQTRRRDDFLWIPDNMNGDGTYYSTFEIKEN